MNKRFRACSLGQPYLMPPSLQEWLPEQHLARFIAETTGALDRKARQPDPAPFLQGPLEPARAN